MNRSVKTVRMDPSSSSAVAVVARLLGSPQARRPRDHLAAMSQVLAEYLQVVLRTAASRRVILPLLAFLLGGGGAAVLWRNATKPIHVEGEPVFKRKRHQELKDGVLHAHGDGHLHSHGDGGSCDEPDAEAEAAFREVLRSLVDAGMKNHAGVRVSLRPPCAVRPRLSRRRACPRTARRERVCVHCLDLRADLGHRAARAVRRPILLPCLCPGCTAHPSSPAGSSHAPIPLHRRATGVLAGHFASLRWPMFFRSHFNMALYALPMAALNAGGAFLEKRVALSVRTILFDRLNDK